MKKSLILFLSVLILLAANEATPTRQPASYTQMQQAINATNTAFPINDMYKVRGKVQQNQEQYKKAREAQYNTVKQYEQLYK